MLRSEDPAIHYEAVHIFLVVCELSLATMLILPVPLMILSCIAGWFDWKAGALLS